MPRSNVITLVDTLDWLEELEALREGAIARRDFVLAEELRAEIADVMASIDGVLDAVSAT